MRSKQIKIGIIGGTGTEALFKSFKPKTVRTPFGKVDVRSGKLNGTDVVFLPRHGKGYDIAPHNVNYRANIWAMKIEKVNYIISIAACGSMDRKIKPGDLALLSDFIDFTQGRIQTFRPEGKPQFMDMTEPYSPEINEALFKAGKKLGLRIHKNVVYSAAQGPRFETRAEIKIYHKLGGQVVGMTQVPEVVLAKEAQIPYGTLAIATNFAAGIQKNISSDEIKKMMADKSRSLTKILMMAIGYLSA